MNIKTGEDTKSTEIRLEKPNMEAARSPEWLQEAWKGDCTAMGERRQPECSGLGDPICKKITNHENTNISRFNNKRMLPLPHSFPLLTNPLSPV